MIKRTLNTNKARNYGTIYAILGSHARVNQFIDDLLASNNAICQSMASFLDDRGFLTTKQVRLAIKLLYNNV